MKRERHSASGEIANYELEGPVDSELARDYLERRSLPRHLQQVRRRYLKSGKVPSREVLAGIARRYSPDVATLLFLETLSSRPDVQIFRQRYEAEKSYVARVGVEAARPDIPDDVLILLVPGWFYETHGAETNADYRIQRNLYERWRIPHQLVQSDENGTVEQNARVVADAVREASKTHRVIVVSASKSGAEVALALGRELEAAETHAVLSWLSIVGVVHGSPLADQILDSRLCFFIQLKLALQGFDLEGAKSMRTDHARPALAEVEIPPHIRMFTYVAVPLSGHISKRGSFGYRRMRELGPNDGLTLLADELVPNAVPILKPGADHFLGPEDQEIWSTAVFRVIAAEVRAQQEATL